MKSCCIFVLMLCFVALVQTQSGCQRISSDRFNRKDCRKCTRQFCEYFVTKDGAFCEWNRKSFYRVKSHFRHQFQTPYKFRSNGPKRMGPVFEDYVSATQCDKGCSTISLGMDRFESCITCTSNVRCVYVHETASCLSLRQANKLRLNRGSEYLADQKDCKVCLRRPPVDIRPASSNSDVCEDKYSNCTKLAEEGECYFFDFEWMRTNCRLSCRYCKPLPVCEDKYSNCTKLAEEGECLFFNFEWMRTNCQLSCRICKPLPGTTPVCKDKQFATCTKDLCSTGDPIEIYESCPFTCEYCHLDSPDECQDLQDNCTALANKGECFKRDTQVFAALNCAKSCKLCKVYEKYDNCYDMDDDCPKKALDRECLLNPNQMSTLCQRSCGYCTNDKCVDHGICDILISHGMSCTSHQLLMLRLCRKKCGFCSETSDDDCKGLTVSEPGRYWSLCVSCTNHPACEYIINSQSIPICKRRDAVAADKLIGPFITPKQCIDCSLRQVQTSSSEQRCSVCLAEKEDFRLPLNCVYDWRFSHTCVDYNELPQDVLDAHEFAFLRADCTHECDQLDIKRNNIRNCLDCVNAWCGFLMDGIEPLCMNKVFGRDQIAPDPMRYKEEECLSVTAPCEDIYENCVELKSRFGCFGDNEISQWNRKICPFACYQCPGSCKDEMDYLWCEKWRDYGECSSVKERCPRTCGECKI